MRSGRKRILKIAFAFASAATFSCVFAADSAPAKAPTAQPEKIEFSGASSTTPKIPRPNFKKDEDLLGRYGNVRESSGPGPQVSAPPPSTSKVMPSRAAAEKMLRDWDKKRNWLVPGAQETEPQNFFEDKNDPEKELSGENREGVMERFMKGDKSKEKAPGPRLRDLSRDRDRMNNKLDAGSRKDRDGQQDDESRDRDPNDNSDSNGLADFNLKKFIHEQNQPNFLNNELPKASQLFRSGFGDPASYRDAIADRAKDRERDAARSAEFMKILRPRGTTTTGFAGVNDPINSPDLTRREMNPITPLSSDSSARSPFGAISPSPASRMQDNSMFGVTGPAVSSITPPVTAPAPRPEPSRARSIVIEPPRRIF